MDRKVLVRRRFAALLNGLIDAAIAGEARRL
jgi:hypothetical protein